MSIALLFITDRPHYAERTLASLGEMCPATFSHRIVVDDQAHELGFAGAIAEGWRRVRAAGAEWVFHLEADFIFNAAVPLDRMQALLQRKPYLAQVALKRQPWNEEEKAAGGIVELHPDDFEQMTEAGDVWTEHRRFWTTNPSLYSAAWCAQPWPQEPRSEGVWTHRLLESSRLRFAFWGAKFDPPLVEHIGVERQGVGY